MKKIKLLVVCMCISILCLFGISENNYSASNNNYTKSSIDLIGKKVKVKGISGTQYYDKYLDITFNILSYDGEKVKLFSSVIDSGGFYNYSGYGNVPVAFENSSLYNEIIGNTKDWKNLIETAGGDTSIYKVDAITLDEVLSIGNFKKVSIEDSNIEYEKTDSTPEWILAVGEFPVSGFSGNYLTKTIEGNKIYTVKEDRIVLDAAETSGGANYGGELRATLETSVYNLVSDDYDIQKYINSLKSSDKKDETTNKAQVVKVSSTGIDKPFIITIVGFAIVIISGITIYTLVKTNISKKK